MSLSLKAGLAAGSLLAALVTLPATAQDTAMAKKDAMDHSMMMEHSMMAPHGMFAGANKHTVGGGYSIEEKDGKHVLMLAADFSLDGAPDPYIVLSGNDMGSGAGTLNLGRLKTTKGPATFPLPAGTDLTKYSHVVVWCKKYNVTLGQAELAAGDKMMHN